MRIGLMAINGVRPYDPQVNALGRSLYGIAERWNHIASLPSLALLTLAGMTGGEHQYEYWELDDLEKEDPLPSDFDLVAISSYSAKIGRAYELSEQYRALGIPTVIGGPHVSCLPEEAAAHCDAVVIGEGEMCWLDLLRDCERGRLKRFYGDLNACFDMARSPMPAYELLNLKRYNRLPVQTSRGCPHRCEFCASSVLIAGKYKQKPIENVLAEIGKIKSLWKRPFIELADDNSFVDMRYWKRLLREMKDCQVRWFTQTDIAVAHDAELLTLLRESGCVQLLIGFESPSPDDLHGLELKSDWKSFHTRGAAEAIRRIQSHGITVLGCFVLGMDAQGPDCFDEVYKFCHNTELFDVQVTVLTPFPGTPLYDRLLREGRLLEPRAWHKCTLYDVNFVPRRMSPEELTEGFNRLITLVYGTEETKWRRRCFRKHLRESKVQS
ncbi:MAG TPA: radical SAM protein [Candidatus Hydrogenedentes bacterium]|nr:radical SAM protein [Candidatus Hydrogenedentota bacterium]HQM48352.1 radical SAM protein [Candidatus Hydrogenedentota bacterium]